MPRRQPTMSYQDLRKLCERWSWIDRRTGVRVTGYNPPAEAAGRRQVPFYIKYLTLRGVVEQGNVICIRVFLRQHQRMIQFVESKQIRRICDLLIIEVDGIRIISQ